jgi:hypothetical protein
MVQPWPELVSEAQVYESFAFYNLLKGGEVDFVSHGIPAYIPPSRLDGN